MRDGILSEDYGSLSGTSTNCAGGPTPWDSWLTCEETTRFTTVPHGSVFDVPIARPSAADSPKSLGFLRRV